MSVNKLVGEGIVISVPLKVVWILVLPLRMFSIGENV